MKISKAANKIELSLTRRLLNMAKEYDNVIDLTLGDPDVPPSEIIRKAASDAIFAGKQNILPMRAFYNSVKQLQRIFIKSMALR